MLKADKIENCPMCREKVGRWLRGLHAGPGSARTHFPDSSQAACLAPTVRPPLSVYVALQVDAYIMRVF